MATEVQDPTPGNLDPSQSRANHIDSRFIGLSTTGLRIRAVRNFEAIQTSCAIAAGYHAIKAVSGVRGGRYYVAGRRARAHDRNDALRPRELVVVSELKRSGYASIITAPSTAMTMITDPRAERNPWRPSCYAQSTCFPSRGQQE